ncbi:MAG: TonB-dependent receptor plug domain-containing protein [Methylorubrum populi]
MPVNPLNAGRIEVIRGPATLRYGSGAIGGVVSAENNQVPTFIPRPRDHGAGHEPAPQASTTAGPGAAQRRCGGRTASRSTPTGSGPPPIPTRSPAASSATRPPQSQGGSVGISAIGERGFVGLAFSHYDALYTDPRAARPRAARTPADPEPGPPARPRRISAAERAVRGAACLGRRIVYRHAEIGIGEDGVEGVQAIFKNREVEARFEAQHVPVFTALGTLTRRGSACRRAGACSTRRLESFLPKTESRMLAAYLFEELAVGGGLRFQAAARIEGRPAQQHRDTVSRR